MASRRGALRELARLDLRDCVLTDDVAHALAHLPLADVRFTAVAPTLSAAGVRALAGAPLHRLQLASERIDDALVAPLAAHRRSPTSICTAPS